MTVFAWIKLGLKNGYQRTPEVVYAPNEPPIIKQKGPHSVPPGQWPSEGPKPSKVAVVLFYLSVIFTMIGTLITIKLFFTKGVSSSINWLYFNLNSYTYFLFSVD